MHSLKNDLTLFISVLVIVYLTEDLKNDLTMISCIIVDLNEDLILISTVRSFAASTNVFSI